MRPSSIRRPSSSTPTRATSRWPRIWYRRRSPARCPGGTTLRTYEDPAAWVRKVAFNLAASRWRRARTAAAYARRQREQHIEGPTPDRVALHDALALLPEQPAARRHPALPRRYVGRRDRPAGERTRGHGEVLASAGAGPRSPPGCATRRRSTMPDQPQDDALVRTAFSDLYRLSAPYVRAAGADAAVTRARQRRRPPDRRLGRPGRGGHRHPGRHHRDPRPARTLQRDPTGGHLEPPRHRTPRRPTGRHPGGRAAQVNWPTPRSSVSTGTWAGICNATRARRHLPGGRADADRTVGSQQILGTARGDVNVDGVPGRADPALLRDQRGSGSNSSSWSPRRPLACTRWSGGWSRSSPATWGTTRWATGSRTSGTSASTRTVRSGPMWPTWTRPDNRRGNLAVVQTRGYRWDGSAFAQERRRDHIHRRPHEQRHSR